MDSDTLGRRVVSAIGDTGDAKGPAAAQGGFLVPVVALVVLLAVFSPAGLLGAPFLVGMSLVAVATAGVLAGWRWRLPPLALISIPVLDLAAIGSLRLIDGVSAVAALVVLPAMWLGVVYRWRGVVIVTVGSIVLLTFPALAHFGTSLDGWSRAVLYPLIGFATAASMSLTAQVWAFQRERLQQQSAQLASAFAKVERQRRLTEAIVQTVDVGLLALGPDGRYESMNPRHREYLQLAFPEGHAGRAGQLGDVFAADNETPLDHDQMPSVRASNGEVFAGYTIWVGQAPHRRAHAVSAQPMFDGDGVFSGAVLAYHDVTDLMQALRVKDEFVSSVSHELRTPLTSIIGYLDLAMEQGADLPDGVGHYLRVAGRNAERLLLLVSDLLTTAQVDGASMRMSARATDLAEVVRSSLDNMADRAKEAGIELRSDVSAVPMLSGDPDRLGQVVDNLVSNSLKYAFDGCTVDVALESSDGELLLTVCDTGIGICEEDQVNLFTKFFRARNAEERAIPGVGLGLVIAKAIVEAHGGTIEVDSAENVGTSVRVRLPHDA